MKIIGLTLLFISSISVGGMFAGTTKSRVKFIHELLRFMNHTKKQIYYFNTPTDQIFTSFDSQDKHFNAFKHTISEQKYDNTTLIPITETLPSDIQKTISEFINELGKSAKNEQTKHIERCEKDIEKYYKELTEQAPKKIKLSISLGLYCGIMLVILFI